jgi:hypothetical protein
MTFAAGPAYSDHHERWAALALCGYHAGLPLPQPERPSIPAVVRLQRSAVVPQTLGEKANA